MKELNSGVAEIQQFVDTLSIDSPFSREGASRKFKTAYRQLHSLLIWNMVVTPAVLTEANYGKHFQEAVSDASQSFALISMSLYKPARMMARSAVENVIRVAVAHQEKDYKVKSVYALFDLALASHTGAPQSLAIIKQLKQLYGELCLTVHSAKEEHLALAVPFEQLLSFDQSQYDLTIEFLKRTASLLNQLIFSLFWQSLHAADHRNRDFVLDATPRALKKVLTA